VDDYSLGDEEVYDMDFIDFSVDIIKTIESMGEKDSSVWDNVKSNLMNKVEHWEKNMNKKKDSIKTAIESPHFVRNRDKFTFVLGVVNLMLWPYLVGAHPNFVPLFYGLMSVLLIGYRFVSYKRLNWHYFLFDFCYFANFWVLAYLFFFPSNGTLFLLCFGMSNGPLIWAIPTWRNSMVFHSIDKVTSVFIHMGPPLVTYSLRWFHESHFTNYNICMSPNCESPFYYYIFLPLIPYIIWQILYYIKVEVLSSHKNRMTSVKWLLHGEKKGFIAKMSMVPFGENHIHLGFILMQFVYTTLTMLVVPFLWYNRVYHVIFIIIMTLISLWNGATFYFDVFSKKYMENLEQKEKKISELKKEIEKTE